MFYFIAQQLDFSGALNLFRYLSFRSGGALATALLIGLIIGQISCSASWMILDFCTGMVGNWVSVGVP